MNKFMQKLLLVILSKWEKVLLFFFSKSFFFKLMVNNLNSWLLCNYDKSNLIMKQYSDKWLIWNNDKSNLIFKNKMYMLLYLVTLLVVHVQFYSFFN